MPSLGEFPRYKKKYFFIFWKLCTHPLSFESTTIGKVQKKKIQQGIYYKLGVYMVAVSFTFLFFFFFCLGGFH